MYRANLRRFWKEHTAHIAVGAFAGLLSFRYPAAAALLMGTVFTRQGLEFAKRRDTPGIDLAYHLAGLIAGVGVGLYWLEGPVED